MTGTMNGMMDKVTEKKLFGKTMLMKEDKEMIQKSGSPLAKSQHSRSHIIRPQKCLFWMATIAFVCMLSVGSSLPARAATPEYGYLWNLVFDFNNSYDGVLTVEVGPWHAGELLAVEESSKTAVRCEPIGDVKLDKGVATFDGNSYLQCSFDIGAVVKEKHKLEPNNPDTYGSIVMRARVELGNDTSAPLFSHPDATFRLDPDASTNIVSMTDLSNNNGAMSAAFINLNWNTWQTYTSYYWCVPDSFCDLDLEAGASVVELNGQGDPVTFSTAPTAFTIGKDANGNFVGRIDALVVDPGNFVH